MLHLIKEEPESSFSNSSMNFLSCTKEEFISLTFSVNVTQIIDTANIPCIDHGLSFVHQQVWN